MTGGRKGFKAADEYVEANQIKAEFGWWERGRFQDSPARCRAELDDIVEMLGAFERQTASDCE